MSSNTLNVHGRTAVDDFADDLMRGIPAISRFLGMSERKAYYAAEQGYLSGVWKEGAVYWGLKSEIAAGLRARAKAGVPKLKESA